MGIRKAAAAAGAALGIAALGVATAGTAGAFATEFDPGAGIYGAIDLDHQETVALRNSPIPGLLDPIWRNQGLIDADPTSRLEGAADGGPHIYADFSDVVGEAAASRYGSVSFGFVDPVRFYEGNVWPGQESNNLLVVQFL